MDDLKNVLMLIGLLSIIAIILVGVAILVDAIKERIRNLKMKHIIKHRFDKPPTAKCYCKDCKHWIEDGACCTIFKGWRTADNWFCWKAEPRKSK